MQRYMKCVVFIAVFLCLILTIHHKVMAEETLTWEDCVREAQKNHPDLISAHEVLRQAKANRAIAISSQLPQINSEVRQSTSKSSSRDTTTDTYSYGVSAQQLLFDGLKTPFNIAASSKNVKAAEYSYRTKSSEIRLKLRTAFVELLKAQELLTITEDIAKRRKQNADLVRLLYEGGREHRGSLLTAQAQLAQADFEVSQARRTIEVAQRQLSKELGRTQVKPLRVAGDFADITVKREKPAFDALAANNPSLMALAAKREAAKFDLHSTKAEFFPNVYANASAGRTDSEWPPDNDQWSVGVSLSFPLFEGGRRWAEVYKAKAALNQAVADERSGQNNISLTLEETWTNWQNAIDNITVQKNFLQAAEERAKITQAQYSNGLISFDNWTIIEDNLVQAKKSYLNAQTNALLTEAQWIQAQGGTLDHVE